jgi:hypothetical protein
MIEMGRTNAYIEIAFAWPTKLIEEMQQAERIGSARDADKHLALCRKKPMLLDIGYDGL